MFLSKMIHPATGNQVVEIPGESVTAVVPYAPDSGSQTIKFLDLYCVEHLAYYKLTADAPDGVEVSPIYEKGVVGCQMKPELKWTQQDNDDNAEGKAFRSFGITFTAGGPGEVIGPIRIDRWVKYAYEVQGTSPMFGRKYDRSRTLYLDLIGMDVNSIYEMVDKLLEG